MKKMYERLNNRSQSPRRLRAKYTPRTNLRFVLWVFRPCGEPVSQLAGRYRRYDTEKIAPQFSPAVPSALAAETATTDKSVAKEISTFTTQNGDDL